jgi:hypothetical protein
MIFSCDRGGETWPDHPVTRVPCPACRVGVGRWCLRPSGHRAAELHVGREHAALASGVLQMCPGSVGAPAPNKGGQLFLDL